MTRPNAGFTLIEVVVAMFIAAVMFALGYGALRQALQNRDHVAAAQARLGAVQTAMRVMAQDFAQIEPRPTRDATGNTVDAALSVVPGNPALATLTRAGWSNPSGAQRSTLQRVSYSFADGKLTRLHWPVLDAAQGVEPVPRQLLDGLTGVSVRLMESPGLWVVQWPPPGATSAPGPHPTPLKRLRPIAVEISLETKDFGKLTRLIEVH